MDKKVVMLSITAFLAVLFLTTIGSSITGYSTINQAQTTLKDFPYPFIKNNAYNGLYIVTPDNSNAEEQAAALKIAQHLKTTQPLLPKIVTISTLPKGEYNLILIGNPCNNELIAKELNNNRCSLGLNTGEGLIQLVSHRRTSSLIVSGDVEKASRVLASNYYPLIGTNIIVKGGKSLSLEYRALE